MTPMDTKALKPCPFCGAAEPIINEIEPHKHHFVDMPDYPGSFTVECAGCDIGVIRSTKDEAIEAWNRRAALTQPAAPSDHTRVVERQVGEAFREFCVRDWNKPSWWTTDDTDRFVTRLSKRIREAIAALSREPTENGPHRYHLTEPSITINGKTFGAGWLLISEAEYAALSGVGPVAITEDMVDRARNAVLFTNVFISREHMLAALKAALATPPASQGDAAQPAADGWCQPMHNGEHKPRTFVVMFEDADMGISVFDNEAEARAFWEKANVSWNCYLLGALPASPAASQGGAEK